MTAKPAKHTITVQTKINSPVLKVWESWTNPRHIVNWNTASDDWHTSRAINDFREGGVFLSRMEARDGSQGFDFTGEYDKIKKHKLIESTLDDGRKVKVNFDSDENGTLVTEVFEAEYKNSIELQKMGWQSILNNFKKYVEDSVKE